MTGTSVALVSRLEDLTRSLDATILASADFASLVGERSRRLGMQTLRGFDEEVEVFAFETLG